MGEGERVWTMMGFLFGEAAEAGQRNATAEAREWCKWFEEWLEERGRVYQASTLKQARLAWRRVARQCGKGPWELRREDVEGHLRWMEGEGYAAATRANMVGIVSSFYEWVRGKGIEVENPAEGVGRPQVGRYVGQALLSREEVGRLVRAMERDKSALGRRDLAFTLARLKTGVALEALRRLRWGEVREGEELPGEVRGAIWEALRAGGRLEGMGEEEFVFAPLREPGVAGVGREYRAEDWAGEKAVSLDALRDSLKLYGRLAGIAEGKLTWMALRRTAMRMRMDAASKEHWLKEMKEFLGSREEEKSTKYRLGKLPGLPGGPEDEMKLRSTSWEEGRTMERKARPFQPGEGVVHGMYMRSQPPEAIAGILAEKIEGMEEEVAGLRVLERGLVERVEGARGRQEVVRLWEAYSRAAMRLGEVIRAEKAMKEEGSEAREAVEDFERKMARWEESRGREEGQAEKELEEDEDEGDKIVYRRLGEEEPELEEEEPEVREAAVERELKVEERGLAEEIAVSRYMLRNVFQRAVGVEEAGEYIRLVDLYGAGCVRLVKMLRVEKGSWEEKLREIGGLIEEAVRAVNEELGIGREEERSTDFETDYTD